MTDDIIEAMAEAIYNAMFDGYYKRPWAAAPAMDQFRCRRAAVAALTVSRPHPKSRVVTMTRQATASRKESA